MTWTDKAPEAAEIADKRDDGGSHELYLVWSAIIERAGGAE